MAPLGSQARLVRDRPIATPAPPPLVTSLKSDPVACFDRSLAEACGSLAFYSTGALNHALKSCKPWITSVALIAPVLLRCPHPAHDTGVPVGRHCGVALTQSVDGRIMKRPGCARARARRNAFAIAQQESRDAALACCNFAPVASFGKKRNHGGSDRRSAGSSTS